MKVAQTDTANGLAAVSARGRHLELFRVHNGGLQHRWWLGAEPPCTSWVGLEGKHHGLETAATTSPASMLESRTFLFSPRKWRDDRTADSQRTPVRPLDPSDTAEVLEPAGSDRRLTATQSTVQERASAWTPDRVAKSPGMSGTH